MDLDGGYITQSHACLRPYMAPEILMPGHRHGVLADVYALGITTFQVRAFQLVRQVDTYCTTDILTRSASAVGDHIPLATTR